MSLQLDPQSSFNHNVPSSTSPSPCPTPSSPITTNAFFNLPTSSPDPQPFKKGKKNLIWAKRTPDLSQLNKKINKNQQQVEDSQQALYQRIEFLEQDLHTLQQQYTTQRTAGQLSTARQQSNRRRNKRKKRRTRRNRTHGLPISASQQPNTEFNTLTVTTEPHTQHTITKSEVGNKVTGPTFDCSQGGWAHYCQPGPSNNQSQPSTTPNQAISSAPSISSTSTYPSATGIPIPGPIRTSVEPFSPILAPRLPNRAIYSPPYGTRPNSDFLTTDPQTLNLGGHTDNPEYLKSLKISLQRLYWPGDLIIPLSGPGIDGLFGRFFRIDGSLYRLEPITDQDQEREVKYRSYYYL
jgi:hypothetical protein